MYDREQNRISLPVLVRNGKSFVFVWNSNQRSKAQTQCIFALLILFALYLLWSLIYNCAIKPKHRVSFHPSPELLQFTMHLRSELSPHFCNYNPSYILLHNRSKHEFVMPYTYVTTGWTAASSVVRVGAFFKNLLSQG